MGKIAQINLGTEKIEVSGVSAETEERYIGGSGYAAALFIQEVSPTIKPYDEENQIIFAVGPFCGTTVPFCGRHFVISKSPLSGILGESSSGGFFGKELKAAGFDYLVIKGKSEKPVYISINDSSITLEPAGDLWGKGTKFTTDSIIKSLGDEKVRIACIGPAGEKLVKYAAIINEYDHAAGRCGMGAIMGDKKVKAIAVRGIGKSVIQDEGALKDAVQELRALIKESLFAGIMSESGTPVHIDTMVTVGDILIKNWTFPRWRGISKLGAISIKARGETKKYPCFNCPVSCKQRILYEDDWVSRPDYETLALLGSNLLVDDLETLIKWNLLVNDLGVDSISLGGSIATCMEALDRKLLEIDPEELGFATDPETKEPNIWGSQTGIENLIMMIANREGIGDDLAEGVKRFCEKKGLPEDLSIQVKGLEVPAHEPRASYATALDYVTTPRGAYHCYEPMLTSFNINWKKELGITEITDRFGIEGTVELVQKIQDASEAYSACGGCIFGFWFLHDITPWINALNAITGRSYTLETWMDAGTRIFNLKRAYNMDCGTTKADDKLNSRFYTPFDKGGARGKVPPLDELLPLYYKHRGWNTDGRPPS